MKTSYLYIIMAILILILLLQRCGGGPSYIKNDTLPTTITIHDTIRIHDTIKGKPVLVWQKADIQWIHDTLYAPSNTYAGLLAQYDSLGDRYFSKKVYTTPYSLGKYGNVSVTDTIVANQLMSSSIKYNINVPTERTIVTLHDPKARQFYVGGGLFGSQLAGLSGGFVAGIYKDRKDRMFAISAGYNTNGITYGLSTYWKVKLK